MTNRASRNMQRGRLMGRARRLLKSKPGTMRTKGWHRRVSKWMRDCDRYSKRRQ